MEIAKKLHKVMYHNTKHLLDTHHSNGGLRQDYNDILLYTMLFRVLLKQYLREPQTVPTLL